MSVVEPQGDPEPGSQPDPQPSSSPEVIEAAKQEARTLIQHTMQVGMQVGGIPNPILDKVTTQNISEGLKNVREDNAKKQNSNRLYFIGTILTLFGMSWLFLSYGKGDLLEKLLPMIVSLAIGFAGGYGIGRTQKK